MPRFFHGGPNAVDLDLYAADALDDETRAARRKEAEKAHPLTRPSSSSIYAEDGKLFLRVPQVYWQYAVTPDGKTAIVKPESQRAPWVPGSITLALPGQFFAVVAPGGSVDVPYDIPEKVIKQVSPHLLTEAEHLARQASESTKPKPSKNA